MSRVLLIAIATITLACSNDVEQPPNIVLIFTDDQGYGDTGMYGATNFETPNLDQLANEGVRFTHFYSAQGVCSASRAGLLTGCYPNRIGVSGAYFPKSKRGINPDETTIAELLKQKDYATAIFGKWHLGHLKPFLPLQNGFDEYFGIPYSNDMWPVTYDGSPAPPEHRKAKQFPPLPLIEGNEEIAIVEDLPDQDNLTTQYTERAVSFIQKNKDKPFFLYLPHSMPHVPLGVSDKFRGKSEQGMYGDVIMEIDWSVGEIMKTLKELDLEDNTLVIFTSDNGPWLNYGNHAGSTGGLREGKGTSWEGGQRVPCIMRMPGITPEGKVVNQLASTIDILPTIAELTGTSLPDSKIDGVSIMELVRGNNSATPRSEFLYYYHQNNLEAVRKGHWKLVLPHWHRTYHDNVPGNDGYPGPVKQDSAVYALYNLRRDPGEEYDVKELYPEVVEDLEKVVAAARADLGDALTDNEGSGRRPVGHIDEIGN